MGIHNCCSDTVGGKRGRNRFPLICLHGHLTHVNKNKRILSGSSIKSFRGGCGKSQCAAIGLFYLICCISRSSSLHQVFYLKNWCFYVKCTWQKKYPNPGTDAPITFYRGGMSNYLHDKRKYQVKTPKIEQLNAKPLPNKGHCRPVFLIVHEITCKWWRETRNTPWKHHRKSSLSSQPHTVTESHKDNLAVKGHQQHKMLYPPKQ